MYKQVILPDQPFRGIMFETNKTFFLPTDPAQKIRVGKGQTKYYICTKQTKVFLI